MTIRSTVNERVQIALESVHGTSVAASKLLECFDWSSGINADVVSYGASGRKYDLIQEENTEWTDLTVTGPIDYNGIVYLLSGVAGKVSATASNSSATAKDWIFTPPVTGSVDPATFTIEQGQTARAHKMTYCLFNAFDYTVTRKAATLSAKAFTQPLIDGITMTASPTAIPLSPAVAKQFNVYIDPTSGAIGTTQITASALSVAPSFDGIYGQFYPINRANLGFTSHVDLKPSSRVKLKVEADSTGMGLLTSLQQGTTQFLRVNAMGPQIASDGGSGSDPVFALFQHDMAIKIGKPSTFSDDTGIVTIEWDCLIVEDETWGMAQQYKVTNLLTAL